MFKNDFIVLSLIDCFLQNEMSNWRDVVSSVHDSTFSNMSDYGKLNPTTDPVERR